MSVKKGIRIILWRLYYWMGSIVKHKQINKGIYKESWGGIKTIRNDLLARAFLKNK